MRPLKLSIKVDATDHSIYNGKLYIVLSDGGLVAVSLNRIFETVKDRYANIDGIEGILNLSFKRNLYWNTQPVLSFTGIPEVKKALMKVWDKISRECVFEVDLSDLKPDILLKNIPSELLDMTIYGQTIYLACLDGLYQLDLDRLTGRTKKKFDAKTYALNTGYCNVILSLGSDGISRYNPFEEKHVKDSSNRKGESISTRWTPAGCLMNYVDASTLEFLSNTIVKLDKDSERDLYAISSFAVSSDLIDEFIRNSDKKIFQDRVLVFNGSNRQYTLTENGVIFDGELKVRKGKLSSIGLNKFIELTDYDYGEALSGGEVAGCPVVEFENLVCLFQNKDSYILEEEPVVSIHTYPKSSHFRDIVSVTTDECVNIHSVDVLSKPCPEVHPQVNRFNAKIEESAQAEDIIIDEVFKLHNEGLSDRIDINDEIPF
ncbi:MAG: hypothetical protein NC453_18805 [Muribaculum sp.]|nr:hypothetical protein [Muribaculum sp.]